VKRCPTCNRSFDDDTLSFCLEDGTPLIRDSASRAESQETLVSPSPSVVPPASRPLPPTQHYDQLGGKATISASQFNTPGPQAYVPAAKQRRKWPWVVGILAIILMVIGGIVMAAVFIPPMLHNTGNVNKPRPTPTRSDWTTTPTPNASPTQEADDVPDDEDEVLSQLTKLEEDWTRANVKGDKEGLERILADEYVGGATTHNKREYIDSLTPDPSIKSWELKDLTVEQEKDRATLKGTLTEETTKGSEVSEFTDTFVWRDHRWQAVASQSTRVK
jgi:hypothetical protein